MEWHGLPPEANTGRLIAGAGAEPYLQAVGGWHGLALDFTAALAALRTAIAAVSASWQGMASSAAQAAFEPYLNWMVATIAIFEARSASAAAQGASYGTAVVATPTLGELAANHFTHGVLEGTNFLGCNTIPIGVNEFEYLVVLWNRAAEAMDEYSAATGVNTAFDPFTIAPSIMAAPGAPESGLAAILAQAAAALPESAGRDALLAELQVAATEGAARGQAQQVAQLAASSAGDFSGGQIAQDGASQTSTQSTQMITQMVSQVPQQASQMGQSVGQAPQQLMQSASQPLQQITQLFQGMSGGDLANQGITPSELASHFGSPEQLGAYGTSAVGSSGGGFSGAGLLSASSSSSSALRAPAGWTQPVAAGPTDEMVRTTATATGSSGAVGSGTGMMGPMSGMHDRSEGSVITLDEPVAEERDVVTTLGFEVFDEDSPARW